MNQKTNYLRYTHLGGKASVLDFIYCNDKSINNTTKWKRNRTIFNRNIPNLQEIMNKIERKKNRDKTRAKKKSIFFKMELCFKITHRLNLLKKKMQTNRIYIYSDGCSTVKW